MIYGARTLRFFAAGRDGEESATSASAKMRELGSRLRVLRRFVDAILPENELPGKAQRQSAYATTDVATIWGV